MSWWRHTRALRPAAGTEENNSSAPRPIAAAPVPLPHPHRGSAGGGHERVSLQPEHLYRAVYLMVVTQGPSEDSERVAVCKLLRDLTDTKHAGTLILDF